MPDAAQLSPAPKPGRAVFRGARRIPQDQRRVSGCRRADARSVRVTSSRRACNASGGIELNRTFTRTEEKQGS